MDLGKELTKNYMLNSYLNYKHLNSDSISFLNWKQQNEEIISNLTESQLNF